MFNLSKHADFAGMVGDASETLQEGMEDPEAVTRSEDEIVGDLGPEADERQRVLDLRHDQELMRVLEDLGTQFPNEVEAMNSVLTNQGGFAQLKAELLSLPTMMDESGMGVLAPQVNSFSEFKFDENSVLNAVRRLNRNQMEFERNRIPLAAFNLQEHKQAQMPMPQAMPEMPMPQEMPQAMPQAMPQEEMGRFPVANEGDFITKFADDLLSFNNEPGTPEYEKARQAAEEIRSSVSPGYEEEANSVIETIMQLDVQDRNTAAQHLIRLYEVLLPPNMKDSEMEPVMSQNQDGIEGIIRYSLTDQVLNNAKPEPTYSIMKVSWAERTKAAHAGKMLKTAADQFGQQYLLYGPTEKRICPKLRGKNLSVGDVVSEYTCRHHCIDGIVIDDNKTICGEALWRANVADKFSREYVDADGNIEGGYINKRFEVNRNVPDENKMRLKPGETRKPRPASQGNMESRLQDMRAKEGQSRDYRPKTNTGDPFEWCHDVDQNNVEVSQAEKDRREKASGHETVQYSNRNQGENNPKKAAFNLQMHKTAQEYNYDNPMGRGLQNQFNRDEGNFQEANEVDFVIQQELLAQIAKDIQKMPPNQIPAYINQKRQELMSNGMEANDQDWQDVETGNFMGPMASSNKQHKTAQKDPYVPKSTPGSHDDYRDQSAVNRLTRKKCTKCKDTVCRCGTGDIGDPKAKSAQYASTTKIAELPGEAPEIATPIREKTRRHPRDTHHTKVNPAVMDILPSDIGRQQRTDNGKPMSKKKAFNLKEAKSPSFKHAQVKSEPGEADSPFALVGWTKESHKGSDDASKKKS